METARNTTLDVVKGISLLTLPAIHSALIYGKPGIRNTLYGRCLAFIAEYMGAPVFMTAMGISMAIGRQKSYRNIIHRSASLLLSGYALNAMKFLIPASLKLLPEELLADNGLPGGRKGLIQLLKTGDILHMGAIACLVCGIAQRLDKSKTLPAALAFLTIFLSPKVWKLKWHPFLNGLPPRAYFPAFPWLSYPLSGLVIGKLLKNDKPAHYGILGAIGLMCLIASTQLSKKEESSLKENFYRLGPAGTIKHIGYVLVLLCICGIVKKSRLHILTHQKLALLSSNLTANYMIQWVVVCWLVSVFGYAKAGLWKTIFASLLNTVFSARLTKLFTKLKYRFSQLIIYLF